MSSQSIQTHLDPATVEECAKVAEAADRDPHALSTFQGVEIASAIRSLTAGRDTQNSAGACKASHCGPFADGSDPEGTQDSAPAGTSPTDEAIRHAIEQFTSPAMAKGDVHSGPGAIIWAEQWGFITTALRDLFGKPSPSQPVAGLTEVLRDAENAIVHLNDEVACEETLHSIRTAIDRLSSSPVSVSEEELARLIDPYAFDMDDDQASPTEREIWEAHAPRKQHEATLKARALLSQFSIGRK
jgi:hypothetical protein